MANADIILISNEPQTIALNVRQGVDFRPFSVEHQNRDKTLFDFSGAAVDGVVKRDPGDSVVVATFLVVVTGAVVFYSLAPTAFNNVKVGRSLMDPRSLFCWYSTVRWPDGTSDCYLKGPLRVDPA